jgi:hemoglobin-like flavoprotein
LDVQRLQESFARMATHGDAVPLFFYSDLFLRHPETRDLFPVSMAAQRDRLAHALGRIVSDVDHVDALGGYLQDLSARSPTSRGPAATCCSSPAAPGWPRSRR